MYAREVSIQLKSNAASGFTTTFGNDILPLLRKQNGFKDEITLLGEGKKDAIATSLWDGKESADQYARGTYAQVLKSLDKVVEGTPKVHAFEVSNSTCHKIAARS